MEEAGCRCCGRGEHLGVEGRRAPLADKTSEPAEASKLGQGSPNEKHPQPDAAALLEEHWTVL
jgi:hypothetical protein